ncbi:outer membrane protein assembly factor BamB family protein [Stieleria varia]|uniref:Outer membrane biogenesis protein BamB n=1 Tax=Stieleria varia TaxID=2528005 RepID=A0A5C6AEP0_9BACT|nr:PQQ-binding-like beta-propeller repeat protein [Stieleria varia]TWT98502.1 outer membrane biogenesis protein BamB [Stieleria varia]
MNQHDESPEVDVSSSYEPESPVAPPGTPAPPRYDRGFLMCVGIAVLGLAVAVVAQVFAPDLDHQNANIVTMVAVAVACIALLVLAHRKLRKLSIALVPVFTFGTFALLAILFRFDGFSGEMWPIFVWRLSGDASIPLPELESESLEDITNPGGLESGSLDRTSPQFLGPNRNGVYARRDFDVPRTLSDVQVLWDQGIGPGWSSFAVADGLAVTQEQREESECLTAYRINDGALVWMQTHPGLHTNLLGGSGPRSTPTIHENRVFALSATGYLWCVDLHTGDLVWTADLNSIAGWSQSEFEQVAPWGHASSPLIVDGLCVLAFGAPDSFSGGRSLIAMSTETGDIAWTAGDDQLSYASPVLLTLAGQRQIVSVNESTVSGHLVGDGKPIWSFSWPGSTNTGANCAAAIPVGSDRVLVGKGYGGGSALYQISQNEDATFSATELWKSSRVMKTKFNHACIDGEIGFGISNGAVQAVDLREASQFWLQPRADRAGQGQMILADDVLIVQCESGEVQFIAATPEQYRELGRLDLLNSKTWNIPTLAGRYLIVRNDRQAVCMLLPQR